MKNGFRSTSRMTTIAVIAILGTAGVAVAASGASTLVTSGDGGATARGSQQPLGTVSATPPAGSGGDQAEGGGPVPLDLDEPEGGGTRGDTKPGGGGGSNSAPDGATASIGGDSASSLPFTGYLAIPVLLLGAVLLGAGVALRRRSAAPPAV